MEAPQVKYLVVEYLQQLQKEAADDAAAAEALKNAASALSDVWAVDTSSAEQQEQHALPGSSLSELLGAGATAMGATTATTDAANAEANPLFHKLLATVTEKGFFRGTEPGEPEYKERYRKMVLRFKDKVKGQQQQQPSPGAAASANVPPPAPSSSAEAAAGTMSAAADEEAAEAFKNEGNVKLQAKDFDGAVASYTAAIQKSLDGPKSHIYFANRAAARQYLKQHKGALDDCELSLARDPNYVKGHIRMAASHAALGDWASAVESYEAANKLEPGNAGTMTALKQAKAKAGSLARQGGGGSSNGGGGMGGMPGGMPAGMPPGIGNMMQNPAMMQQAQAMMQNPAMMQQAMKMMQNPAMMQQAMAMMGGGGGAGGPGGGGGMPDAAEMEAAMKMMQGGGGF